MTGWVSARQDVDWKPLLEKIPQFEVFVKPPKDVQFYVEPVWRPGTRSRRGSPTSCRRLCRPER